MGSLSPAQLFKSCALVFPLITAVGTLVSIQQMRLARIKLQPTFPTGARWSSRAVCQFRDETVTKLLVPPHILHTVVIGTADAEFLFFIGGQS